MRRPEGRLRVTVDALHLAICNSPYLAIFSLSLPLIFDSFETGRCGKTAGWARRIKPDKPLRPLGRKGVGIDHNQVLDGLDIDDLNVLITDAAVAPCR